MNYSISKISYVKDGKRRVPMSPGLFMEDMNRQIGIKYDELFRVWFDPVEIHQVYEGKNEMTGYDQLITVKSYNYGGRIVKHIAFFIDMGTNGCPVAMMFDDENEITITPIYQDTEFIQKLKYSEIKNLFTAVSQMVDSADYN